MTDVRRGDQVDLQAMILATAEGRFPPVDGGWSRARPWRAGTEGAIAFTGHAVLAVGDDISDRDIEAAGVHGFGGAHDPAATLSFAGHGPIGILDVLTVARGTGHGSDAIVEREDLRDHPRVAHAATTRDEIRVLGFNDAADTSVLTIGRGIAGLPEVGMEIMGSSSEGIALDPSRPADRIGKASALLTGALGHLPVDTVALASVSPGNARSLRLFLRHGFTPIGSVQLWSPDRRRPAAEPQ